jgi:hypothetical protein
LTTLEEAMQWYGGGVGNSIDPPDQRPAWLVAVKGNNLYLSDIGFAVDPSDNPPIEGIWYIWVASGAGLTAMGGLNSSGGVSVMTYNSIQTLTSQYLSIFEPTPFPTSTSAP